MPQATKSKRREGKRREGKRAKRAPAASRPRFAESYPRAPELDHVLQAFEQGDFARVNSEAERLARTATDEEVRLAAQDLQRRTRPEPAAMYLWAIGVLLAIFIYGYYALAH